MGFAIGCGAVAGTEREGIDAGGTGTLPEGVFATDLLPDTATGGDGRGVGCGFADSWRLLVLLVADGFAGGR